MNFCILLFQTDVETFVGKLASYFLRRLQRVTNVNALK